MTQHLHILTLELYSWAAWLEKKKSPQNNKQLLIIIIIIIFLIYKYTDFFFREK